MINECSPETEGGLGPPIARAAVLVMWIWMQGVHELVGLAYLNDADEPIPFELADPEDDDEQGGGGCRV
ncbi:hypothetical protein [Streptomyces synnematoformans]|uniref:Uncharacterized protein n=1 Tax=Streptomyces synnematoformans TaxID=415721 RepID=A0ABP5IY44_9ACTN